MLIDLFNYYNSKVTPMERISTGIDLLDSKLSGGYPKDKGM
jgi:hypothetical protein